MVDIDFDFEYYIDILGDIQYGDGKTLFDANDRIGDVCNDLVFYLNLYINFKKFYLEKVDDDKLFIEFEREYLSTRVLDCVQDTFRKQGLKASTHDIACILDQLVVDGLIEKKW